MSKQRPSICHEAASAFGPLSGNRILVLETHPHEGAHYVVVDRKNVVPLFDTSEIDLAKRVADRYSALADMSMLVEGLNSKVADVYLYTDSNVASSREGLPLLSQGLSLAEQTVTAASDVRDTVDDEIEWPGLNAMAQAIAEKCESNPRPQTLVFSFYTPIVVQEEEGPSFESERAYIHLGLDWDDNGDIKSAKITLLDEDCQIDGRPFYKLLYSIDASPAHEVWYEDAEEKSDWMDQIERMPHFSQIHEQYPDARVFAYEGGDVLRHIASRPDASQLVVQQEGEYIPLRVVHVPQGTEFSERVMRNDQQQMASLFLQDRLYAHEHKCLMDEQKARGFAMGQAVGGSSFSNIASFSGKVVLEAAVQPQIDEAQTSRMWLSYRLWVNDLLVMDVQPSNEALYAERGITLPTSESQTLSSVQIGQLLQHALTVEPTTNAQTADRSLLQNFLQSDLADRLRLKAAKLVANEAHIENGGYVRHDSHELTEEKPATLGL